MEQITIAIIDDHDLFREGIILVLKQCEGFVVDYETSDGNNFLDYLRSSRPDVVLMDINMPKIDGIETTKKALQIYPDLKIIALTMFSDNLHYTQMVNAGVKGFVLKQGKKYELQQAVIEVFKGGNYFSQEILQKLAFQSIHVPSKTDHLTSRELDVLGLVCKGFTSQEIADKLFISAKTVEVHRTNIFQKANVRNSAELIVWAVKNNYYTIE